MSITLLNQPNPSSYNAACAPVWVRGQSDFSLNLYVISSISDDSGSVMLSFGPSPGYVVGMVLNITGSTGDYAYLLGEHNVTDVSGSTVTIDLDYQAASTGTIGLADKVLDKFAMKVYNYYTISGNDYAIGTYYTPFDNKSNSPTALKDISRIISSIFTTEFSLTTGWLSGLNKGLFYITTEVSESSLKVDNSRVDFDTETVEWIAIRSTMITGRVLASGSQNKLLNGTTNIKAHAGTKVILSMLTTEPNVNLYYSYSFGGTPTDGSVAFTASNYKGNYTFTVPSGTSSVSLYITDDDDLRISEILTITVLGGSGCNVYPLYWLNHYGGYDVYEFVEQAETNATGNRQELRGYLSQMGTMIDKDFSTESWQEIKLIGRNESQTDLSYLRDLIASPEIYNASGERVKLLTTNLVTLTRENTTPEITILTQRGAVIC